MGSTNLAGNNGRDRFRDSMLDFIFTSQGARDSEAEAKVIVRPGDYPDDEPTSDHQPVEATLDLRESGVDIGAPRE